MARQRDAPAVHCCLQPCRGGAALQYKCGTNLHLCRRLRLLFADGTPLQQRRTPPVVGAHRVVNRVEMRRWPCWTATTPAVVVVARCAKGDFAARARKQRLRAKLVRQRCRVQRCR
jgi:hypothetical protein